MRLEGDIKRVELETERNYADQTTRPVVYVTLRVDLTAEMAALLPELLLANDFSGTATLDVVPLPEEVTA